jgi:multiple sugar transport system ATP-binding protein
MDEPLSNLDALLRLEMRAELKRLLAELRATTIYVTHDQIEALSMGDRIAVMRNGAIQQYDYPMRVYDEPANQFIGGFIGNPPMNFLDGHVETENGRVKVTIGPGQGSRQDERFHFTPSDTVQPMLRAYTGKPVRLGIRAENMETLDHPAPDALRVRVHVVEPLGSQNLLTVHAGEHSIKVSTHPTFEAQPDQDLWLRFPAGKIRWIDPDTGLVLYPA